MFWAAAEAEPDHILKLYSVDGVVLNISPLLEANSRDSSYRLEVVASDPKSEAPPTSRSIVSDQRQTWGRYF